jgi:aspartyl/glutamyl-tRNA(Asn/Gln) amidotransferase C subunit
VSLSAADVLRIANLAKLRLASGEEERLREDTTNILEFVDRLGEAGAEEGVAPTSLTDGRDDDAREGRRRLEPDPLSHEPGAMAPQWEDGLFLVPPPSGVTPEGS